MFYRIAVAVTAYIVADYALQHIDQFCAQRALKAAKEKQ